MKNALLLGLLLTLSLATASPASKGVWTARADMPTARFGLSAAVLDGQIYAVGGATGPQESVSAVEAYDPKTDTWTTKSPLPTSRHSLSVCAVNGRIYAIGGQSTAPPNPPYGTVEEYDPTTDTWTTKSPMPTPRFGFSTSVVNGKIYAISGTISWPTTIARVEEYDPATDTWTRKADIPTPRWCLSTSAVDGKIYAIGGAAPYPTATGVVDVYDPATDTWAQSASMPTARTELATCVLGGKIYAVGGALRSDVAGVSIVEAYDPATDTWEAKADMPTARNHLAASAVDGKIYAIGGSAAGFPWSKSATVEEYDPSPLIVDFNGDGMVDIEDLLKLIESWGQDDPLLDIAPPVGDGLVDVLDLEVLMGFWGQTVHDPMLGAHWRFDEAEGIIAYDSAGQNDGVVVGAAWQPEEGALDGALLFDGVDDQVVTDGVLDPSDGSFSVLVWIKGGAPGQVIVSQADGVNWLSINASTGTLVTELVPPMQRTPVPPLVSDVVVTDDAWHGVAFVWDGSTRSLYVDATLVAQDEQGSLAESDGGMYIGCGADQSPDSFFSGLIDDVRLYNRAVRP